MGKQQSWQWPAIFFHPEHSRRLSCFSKTFKAWVWCSLMHTVPPPPSPTHPNLLYISISVFAHNEAYDFYPSSRLSGQAWECRNDSVLILLKQIVQVPSLQQHYLHMCLVPSFRTTDRSPSNAFSLVHLKNNHCGSQSSNFAGRRKIRDWKMGSSSHWLDFAKADMWHLRKWSKK